MKYIQLNDTDLNVSRICLGTAGFGDKTDQEKSFEILDDFVRAGGNFIDTANVYCKWLEGHGNCSEQIIGRWLKARGARGKVIAPAAPMLRQPSAGSWAFRCLHPSG